MRINYFLCLVFMVIATSGFGQYYNYKYGVSAKKVWLDYQSQNGGNLLSLKDYHHGFELGLQTKLAKSLYINIPFKYANINGYSEARNAPDECLHLQLASLDGILQYHFFNKTNRLVPYGLAGVGGVYELNNSFFNLQVPIGVGLNIQAADNAYINLQSEYRYSFDKNRNNLHHAVGFVYLFGKMAGDDATSVIEEKVPMTDNDRDKDGIKDDIDLCPDSYGGKDTKGCPDQDGDGIADFQDQCPDVKGAKTMGGCPDSDNDGVSDKDDNCPNVPGIVGNKGCPQATADLDNDGVLDKDDKCPDMPGSKSNMGCPAADRDGDGIVDAEDRCPDSKGNKDLGGCPDRDNDGIADSEDKCPNAAGLKVYAGCPDSDGDGLDDSIDRCPNTPGTVASGGCPDIKKEDRQTLDVAMRAVQFETGKATLKSESFGVLKQIASILSRYPDYNLSISGHTDNTGNAVANQELSEKRAQACYEYLATQGIDRSRMSHAGYGESRPIADNESLNGRTLNRRVEFNLIPR